MESNDLMVVATAATIPDADTEQPCEVSFTIEEFNKIVESIARAQARATVGIAKALVMAVYFANVQKDAGAANALMGCLRKSTKQAGIQAFLEHYGALAWTKIGKKPGFEYFEGGGFEWTKEAVDDLKTAASDWESFKPESATPMLDLLKMLESAVKKTESATKSQRAVEHAELLEQVKKIVSKARAVEMDATLRMAA